MSRNVRPNEYQFSLFTRELTTKDLCQKRPFVIPACLGLFSVDFNEKKFALDKNYMKFYSSLLQ